MYDDNIVRGQIVSWITKLVIIIMNLIAGFFPPFLF